MIQLNKMKIAWLVNNYPNINNNGVGGIFFERMINSLSNSVETIYVIQPIPYIPFFLKNKSKFSQYIGLQKKEIRGNVIIYRPSYFAFPNQYYWGLAHVFIYLSVKRLKIWKDVNIIDAKYSYPNGGVAYLLHKKFKIKYVISTIGSDINVDTKKSKINLLIQKFFIKKSHGLITVSKALGEEVQKIVKKSYVIINDGLNIENRLLKKTNYNKPKGKIKFCFVGEICHDKGIHLISNLLDNFPLYSSDIFEWHLIGKVTDDYNLKSYNNVIFYHLLDNFEVLKMLESFDLLVFPSLNEGIPNTLKEAALFNLPVLASNVGGIPSFLDYGKRGYIFESENIEDLQIKIQEIINNWDEAGQKANKLYDYVVDNFDSKKNSLELLNYYKLL
jgi:glycosyltransferase involved in cell wall biosynthesis